MLFNDVVFDSFTLKENDNLNDWSRICKECVSKHKINSNLLDEAGSGICGVEDCNNESDYYIDFPDNSITLSIFEGK